MYGLAKIAEIQKQPKCVVVMGNPDIIAKFPQESSKLYQFLIQTMQGARFQVVVKPASAGANSVDLVGDADVVVAHSQGASRVAQWMTDKNFPNVKAVFLLDPNSNYLGNWNGLRKTKMIFASNDPSLKDNYTGMSNVVMYRDNHFFANSMVKVGLIIRSLLSQS